MTDPGSRLRLTPTRIFLIVFVAVALALATMTIMSSLNVWRANDAAVVTVAPPAN